MASHFQALEVERHGKERAFVHVYQVASRQITGVKAAAMNRLPLSGSYRIDDDVRVLIEASEGAGRKHNCLSSRQHLRPAVRQLAHLTIEGGQRLRHSSRRRYLG